MSMFTRLMALLVCMLGVGLMAGAAPVAAHLADGVDITQGQYLIDFSWSPKTVTVGLPEFMAINLVDAKTATPIQFDHVFVRLDDATTQTVGSWDLVQQQPGSVSFVVTPAQAGTHVLLARFSHDGKVFLEATTSVLVVPAAASTPPESRQSFAVTAWVACIGIVLIAAGMLIGWSWKRA